MAFKQKKCNAKLTDSSKLKYGNKFKGKSFRNFDPSGVSIPIVYNDGADSHINPSGDVNKTVGFFSDIYKKVSNGVESVYAKSISLKAEFLDRIKKEKAYLSIGAGRNDLELEDNDIYSIKDIHHVALIFGNNIAPRTKGCFIESITDSNNDDVNYMENAEFVLNDNAEGEAEVEENPISDKDNDKVIEEAVIKVLNNMVKEDESNNHIQPKITPEVKVDNSLSLLNKLVENGIDIKQFIEYKGDEDFKDLNDDKIIKIIKKNAFKPQEKSIQSEVDAMSFEKNDKNAKKDVDNNSKTSYDGDMKAKAKAFLEKRNKQIRGIQ